jgi:hypothetical protein
LSTQEPFYKVTDRTLRFTIEHLADQTPDLLAVILDHKGKEVIGGISPVQMPGTASKRKDLSSTGQARFSISLNSHKLKDGKYTLVVSGLRTPRYLRFKLETEDVEN